MDIRKILIGTASASLLLMSGAWFLKAQNAQALSNTPVPKVGLTEAVETVLTANPGTTAVDVNLETEKNVLAWEVELNNDLEVYIDANTGEIIHTEQGWNLADIPLLQNWLPN